MLDFFGLYRYDTINLDSAQVSGILLKALQSRNVQGVKSVGTKGNIREICTSYFY